MVAWMGERSPLLDSAWSLATVFHICDERAMFDLLRARLVSGVVLDIATIPGNVSSLAAEIRAIAPHIAIMALVDAPPNAPITTAVCRQFDFCLSRHTSPTDLAAGLQLLTLRTTRRLAEDSTGSGSAESGGNNAAALRERLRHLEGLVQTTFTISRTTEERDILSELRQAARVAIDVDDMVVLLADDDLVDLSDTLLRNAPLAYLEVCRTQLYSLPFDRRMTYLGDEVLLRDLPQNIDPESTRAREARALGAESYMRLPLLIDQRVIGFVAFYARQPGRFTGAHLQLGRLFVTQVAATVRNIRLYVRVRQAEERQRAVSQVARVIADLLELKTVLSLIVGEAMRLVNGGAGMVALREPDGSLIVRAVDGRAPQKIGERIPPGVGQAGLVAQSGEPSIVTNYAEWEHANPALRNVMPKNTALVCVPLSYHGEILGVLQLVTLLLPPAELDAALDVLLTLAPQAAIAIAKAQLHEQVEQDRRQLRAVLDHTSAAVAVCDASGRALMLNPATEQALRRIGIAPERFFQQPVAEVLRDYLPGGLPELNDLHGPFEVSLGAAGQFIVQIAPITNADGQIERIIGVGQDVSEIRRADRMRSDMVGVLTHDMGNLIMLARNPIDMLEDPHLRPDQRDNLRQMLVSSLIRMEQLVRDVTDLDRVEQSGVDAAKPYHLPQVVRQVVESNQADAAQKSITLRYHELRLPAEPLRGIEVLIKQAVDNLVSNAIKYTPDGGHVDVALDMIGEEVLVRVADDGYGIPADKQRFIFDPFYRVKGDRRLAGIHGTGLGLSLVKTIVERHGGRVEMQSDVESGSVFTLHLPLEEQMQPPSQDVVVRIDLSRMAEQAAATEGV